MKASAELRPARRKIAATFIILTACGGERSDLSSVQDWIRVELEGDLRHLWPR